MIYRGPGFLAVVRFGSYPTLPPPVSLSQSSCMWEGVGEELNHTTARKPGPPQIIQYSLALSLLLKFKIQRRPWDCISIAHASSMV
jgi:hypothetical protein